MPHVTFIHGISNKPPEDKLLRIWTDALIDNILIDHQYPKIHYRTPTEGGSSGSLVFNQQ